MGRASLIPVLLLLGCAQTTSQQPPPQPQAPLRATSGPVSRPQTITDADRPRRRPRPRRFGSMSQQPGSLRDGCPVVDRDGDGISDRFDKCPDVAEVARRPGRRRRLPDLVGL
jgi:hypothetical protein